jgi:hypothetical protein
MTATTVQMSVTAPDAAMTVVTPSTLGEMRATPAAAPLVAPAPESAPPSEPPPPAAAIYDSPAAVAARYAAVGRALRGAPDALWKQYRRIRINEAIATHASRRATLAALSEIERAIH